MHGFQRSVTLDLYARTAGYDFRIEAPAPDINGATTATAITTRSLQSAVVPGMKLPRHIPPAPTQGHLAFLQITHCACI